MKDEEIKEELHDDVEKLLIMISDIHKGGYFLVVMQGNEEEGNAFFFTRSNFISFAEDKILDLVQLHFKAQRESDAGVSLN